MKNEITILGGGIAGLTTAIALNRVGIKPIVFEAAPEIRALGAGIALAANAMIALDRLGIRDEVVRLGRVLPSFSILDQEGKLITKTDSQRMGALYGVDNFTIHRAELHRLLLSKIDPDSIQANKKAVDVKQTQDSVTVFFDDGSKHKTELLIAADGIHSGIRKKLIPDSEPRYAGYTCWRAVIDNTELDLSESSETWGSDGRFGIVPLAHKKLYWFACMNAQPADLALKRYKVEDLLNHFGDYHEPIPEILKETKDESLLWNDINDLKPINQYAFENILLIGDAAHATTPNMGQGACQAIEDAVILMHEIDNQPDIIQAFKTFEKRRLKRTHDIINMSWRIGKIAQMENPLMGHVRNFLFRLIPSSVNEKQLKKLYEVDF